MAHGGWEGSVCWTLGVTGGQNGSKEVPMSFVEYGIIGLTMASLSASNSQPRAKGSSQGARSQVESRETKPKCTGSYRIDEKHLK